MVDELLHISSLHTMPTFPTRDEIVAQRLVTPLTGGLTEVPKQPITPEFDAWRPDIRVQSYLPAIVHHTGKQGGLHIRATNPECSGQSQIGRMSFHCQGNRASRVSSSPSEGSV